MPLWAVVIVVAVWGLLVLFLVSAFRARARVDLTLDGGVLVVGLGFWDRFLCLRRAVRVPLSEIRAVRAVGLDEVPRPGLRFPGAYLPGVVTAGSYGFGDNRTFWDVRRAERVLLVLCRPGAEYTALVLEVPDPDAAANRLARSAGRG